MQEIFEVGIITGTHGLKGEVKVHMLSDDPKRFESLSVVTLTTPKKTCDLTIEGVRYFKGRPILKFRDHDRIEDVEEMKGGHLFVGRKDAIPLDENEYYVGDLIGLLVETEEGIRVGILKDVLPTGANDVYLILDEEGNEILIPAIRDCIRLVDLAASKMVVRLLPGL